MFRLTPKHPAAKDPVSGQQLTEEGVLREILLPPDHYAERIGDIEITEIEDAPAAPAAASESLPNETPTAKAGKK